MLKFCVIIFFFVNFTTVVVSVAAIEVHENVTEEITEIPSAFDEQPDQIPSLGDINSTRPILYPQISPSIKVEHDNKLEQFSEYTTEQPRFNANHHQLVSTNGKEIIKDIQLEEKSKNYVDLKQEITGLRSASLVKLKEFIPSPEVQPRFNTYHIGSVLKDDSFQPISFRENVQSIRPKEQFSPSPVLQFNNRWKSSESENLSIKHTNIFEEEKIGTPPPRLPVTVYKMTQIKFPDYELHNQQFATVAPRPSTTNELHSEKIIWSNIPKSEKVAWTSKPVDNDYSSDFKPETKIMNSQQPNEIPTGYLYTQQFNTPESEKLSPTPSSSHPYPFVSPSGNEMESEALYYSQNENSNVNMNNDENEFPKFQSYHHHESGHENGYPLISIPPEWEQQLQHYTEVKQTNMESNPRDKGVLRRKQIPWRKIVQFLSTIIPVGLLVSALNPNVVIVNPNATLFTTSTAVNTNTLNRPLNTQLNSNSGTNNAIIRGKQRSLDNGYPAETNLAGLRDIFKILTSLSTSSEDTLVKVNCAKAIVCDTIRKGETIHPGVVEQTMIMLNRRSLDPAVFELFNEIFNAVRRNTCDQFKCNKFFKI